MLALMLLCKFLTVATEPYFFASGASIERVIACITARYVSQGHAMLPVMWPVQSLTYFIAVEHFRAFATLLSFLNNSLVAPAACYSTGMESCGTRRCHTRGTEGSGTGGCGTGGCHTRGTECSGTGGCGIGGSNVDGCGICGCGSEDQCREGTGLRSFYARIMNWGVLAVKYGCGSCRFVICIHVSLFS